MQVTPGMLPQGFCPASEQARLNTYAANLAVTFPLGLGNFSFSNTVPDPDMQSFPWFRLNSDGTPDRWYVYANGSWIAPNPIAANDPAAIRFHPGPYAVISTYDGGESGTVTSDSGPMWQVVGQVTNISTDYGTMGGRIPVGISADFGEGATGGSQAHTIVLNEVPPHTHNALSPSTQFLTIGGGTGGGQGNNGWIGTNTTASAGGNTDESTTPINIMNPWISGYWIARTSRIFYRA